MIEIIQDLFLLGKLIVKYLAEKDVRDGIVQWKAADTTEKKRAAAASISDLIHRS